MSKNMTALLTRHLERLASYVDLGRSSSGNSVTSVGDFCMIQRRPRAGTTEITTSDGFA
ncbi:hypothetical protein PUN28_008601 [Cardiocondyla obscurior]|uniref:Uncharacterized protein n=1 Tax=Cardiocondyla obscurior TaxID=286306 RepID=A0AAW2FZY8_9HYME